MLDMYDTALEMEVERRREVLLATMRAARGRKPANRLAPGAMARHVWAAIATALS